MAHRRSFGLAALALTLSAAPGPAPAAPPPPPRPPATGTYELRARGAGATSLLRALASLDRRNVVVGPGVTRVTARASTRG